MPLVGEWRIWIFWPFGSTMRGMWTPECTCSHAVVLDNTSDIVAMCRKRRWNILQESELKFHLHKDILKFKYTVSKGIHFLKRHRVAKKKDNMHIRAMLSIYWWRNRYNEVQYVHFLFFTRLNLKYTALVAALPGPGLVAALPGLTWPLKMLQ